MSARTVATVRVFDEHFGAPRTETQNCVELRLATRRVSAREIITKRVSVEVEKANKAGDRLEIGHTIEREIDRTVDAFANRIFILLVDDVQIEDLDEGIGLKPESEVVFLYIARLKGG